MSITTAERKTSRYPLPAAAGDVSHNGKTRLPSSYQNKLDILNSLYGSLPDDISEEAVPACTPDEFIKRMN